ncbi:MAG: hypothetical protein FJ308_11025 [Planctomycetes bacterium]|nr:hypothetical protein [Planctomycetota bacterium]
MGTRFLFGSMLVMLVAVASSAQEPDTLHTAQKTTGEKTALPRRVCLVVGAAGEVGYGEEFQKWAGRIQSAMHDSELLILDGVGDGLNASSDVIPKGPDSTTHRERILRWIRETPDEASVNWFIFLGHGTHEGKVTQLNLLGPDLSSKEFAEALSGKTGRWVFVFCNSSSAPFMASIAGPNRVVITATKSGSEQNFSRFGDYFSQALSDLSSDLDHDHMLSVLEVFLTASSGVAKYYEDRGLLATEQALMDDTGDGRGTPAVFYRGLRAVKGPSDKASLDGDLAKRVMIGGESGATHSADALDPREELEDELDRLRSRKGEMDIDQYYLELERLFLLLAQLQSESAKR